MRNCDKYDGNPSPSFQDFVFQSSSPARGEGNGYYDKLKQL